MSARALNASGSPAPVSTAALNPAPARWAINRSATVSPTTAVRLGSIPEVACPEGWHGYDPAETGGLGVALAGGLAAAGRAGLREHILAYTATRYDWAASGQRAVALYRSILDRVAGTAPAAVRD